MRVQDECWQGEQLLRLAKRCPDRFGEVWATVCREFPELPAELALAAVEQGELSTSDCAEFLQIAEDQVDERIEGFRTTSPNFESAVVVDEGTRIAKIDDGQVAVWEIVREYRKLGSAERVLSTFRGISPADLTAALRYAEQNPAEIDAQIEQFEEHLRKKRVDHLYAG